MNLEAFTAIMHLVPSWEWSLIQHTMVAPAKTHPTGLQSAKRGLNKILGIAREIQDQELESETLVAIAKIESAQAGKVEKDEEQDR